MYVCVYLIIYNYIYMFNVGIDIVAVFVCCDVEFKEGAPFPQGMEILPVDRWIMVYPLVIQHTLW